MDKGKRRNDDGPAWQNPNVHVWRHKLCDLTIVNLRDTSEMLAVPLPAEILRHGAVSRGNKETGAAITVLGASKQGVTATQPSHGEQGTNLSTLLAKIQTSRQREPKPVPEKPHGGTSGVEVPVDTHSFGNKSEAKSHSVGSHEPVFPETSKQTGMSTTRFEIISGTKIPGQGVVSSIADTILSVPPSAPPVMRTSSTVATPAPAEVPQSLALFHDPLWGDASGAICAPVPESTDQPRKRPLVFDLYGDDSAQRAPAAPALSLDVSTSAKVAGDGQMRLKPSQLETQMAVAAAAQTSMPGAYPYMVPVPYVQHPLQPGLLSMNPMQYYAYGAQQLGGPQQPPSHLAMHQAYQPAGNPIISTSSSPRPGTNVEAAPFVPGAVRRVQ